MGAGPESATTSITLASIAIRAAVGTIATVATAMIASVAAERRGVQLHAVSQVSIARFSNSGPLSLGLLALRGSALDPVIRLIVALLILSTLAAQFTSTLFVSGLEHGQVRSFPRTVPHAYALEGDSQWVSSYYDINQSEEEDLWRRG